MRFVKALLGVACLAAVMLVPQAGLAATHDIAVSNNQFTPAYLQATSGDTLKWTVTQGGHDITSYAGGQSWSSSLIIFNDPDPTYTQTFGGGTAWYRCTPHSAIIDGGVCSGMCGVVTDKTSAPGTPAITSPVEGSSGHSSPVTVSGTGEAWTIVKLTEGATELPERAMVQGDGTWSVALFMPDGQHTITATGVGPDGTTLSAGTDSQTFTIGAGPDTVKPTATITSPTNFAAFLGNIGVTGVATDNVALAGSVVVRARHLILGDTTEVTATWVSLNPSATFGVWSAVFEDLFPGLYELTAVSRDTAGNTSDPSAAITIISLEPNL